MLSSPFWTRHFGDDEAEVPWERFGAAFKSDVDALGGLPGELQSPAPEHVDWALDLVRQELEVPADGAVARASLDAFGAARGHGGPGTADVWFLGEVGKLSQLGHPT